MDHFALLDNSLKPGRAGGAGAIIIWSVSSIGHYAVCSFGGKEAMSALVVFFNIGADHLPVWSNQQAQSDTREMAASSIDRSAI